MNKIIGTLKEEKSEINFWNLLFNIFNMHDMLIPLITYVEKLIILMYSMLQMNSMMLQYSFHNLVQLGEFWWWCCTVWMMNDDCMLYSTSREVAKVQQAGKSAIWRKKQSLPLSRPKLLFCGFSCSRFQRFYGYHRRLSGSQSL